MNTFLIWSVIYFLCGLASAVFTIRDIGKELREEGKSTFEGSDVGWVFISFIIWPVAAVFYAFISIGPATIRLFNKIGGLK